MDARKVLREAHRIFEGLGARPWADRVARELVASGARDRRPARDACAGLGELTPQELQIARAVAGGKNNGEVSAALFVSRKTVEAHLTRIYRKLEIHSRVELTRVKPQIGPERFSGLQELTPQELQIARAVAGGKNNCEVSAALFVSRKTVEAHLTRIYRKLGIHSRVELTRVLLESGITD